MSVSNNIHTTTTRIVDVKVKENSSLHLFVVVEHVRIALFASCVFQQLTNKNDWMVGSEKARAGWLVL